MVRVRYRYLCELGSAWVGPRFLATRSLGFDTGTSGYVGWTPILMGVSGDIVNSLRPKTRSSVSVVISNEPLLGVRFSDHFSSGRIQNIPLKLYRLWHGEQSAILLMDGIIFTAEHDQHKVLLDAVDERVTRSIQAAPPLNATTWPRIRKEDIGKSAPVIFGKPEDVLCPIIKHNPYTGLKTAIDDSSTADIEVDDVSQFPSSGSVEIDEETISYTGVNTGTNKLTGITRGASSTKKTPHRSGATVISKDEFAVGFDAIATTGSSVLDQVALVGEERYPLDAPTKTIDAPNSMTYAKWSKTPMLKVPNGEMQGQTLELNGDGGSSALFPERARGGDMAYTESNWTEVYRYTGAKPAWIGLRADAYIAPPGHLKKVYALVNHSGNSDRITVEDGTSLIKTTRVLVERQGVTPRIEVGVLTDEDVIFQDYQEIAAKQGRRATQVLSDSDTSGFNVKVSPNKATRSGIAIVGFYPANPMANTHDNSGGSVGVAEDNQVAETCTKITYTLTALPGGLDPDADLALVRARIQHGGPGPHGAESVGSGGQTYTVKIIENVTQKTNVSYSTNAANQVIEGNEYAPSGLKVKDLVNKPIAIEVQFNTVLTIGRFNLWDVWFAIDYTSGAVEQGSGSVLNMFDVTNTLDTWEKVANGLIDIRVDENDSGIRLYHAGFVALYEPYTLRPAERVALDLQADSSFRDIPGNVANLFWVDTRLGNNSAATFDGGEVEDEQLNAGYGDLQGTVRDTDIFEVIQRIAEQARFRAFMFAGKLTFRYLFDLASLPAVTKRIGVSDLVSMPKVQKADLERDIVNRLAIRYDFTDVEEYRAEKDDSDATSITNFGEHFRELDWPWLSTSADVDLSKAPIMERDDTPFDRVTFVVTVLHDDLAPGDLLEVDFPWFQASHFEVEETIDRLDHTIEIRGRKLK